MANRVHRPSQLLIYMSTHNNVSPCAKTVMASLVEVDALEVLVIVDNEVDPISSYSIPGLTVSGQLADVARRAPLQDNDRGSAKFEIRLDNVCCGAHGLSLMIVGNPRVIATPITMYRQPSKETNVTLSFSTQRRRSTSGN